MIPPKSLPPHVRNRHAQLDYYRGHPSLLTCAETLFVTLSLALIAFAIVQLVQR